MASVNTEKFIAGLKEYFVKPEIKALWDEIFNPPFKISKVAKVVALVVESVKVVEQLAADMGEIGAGTGAEKKDAVVKFLDGSIELPFYLEPLDGPIIGIVVDAVVGFFNLRFKKAWLDKVKSFF